MRARVNLVVGLTVVLLLAVIGYGVFELYKEHGYAVIDFATSRTGVIVIGGALAAVVVSRIFAAVVITHKVNKLARVAAEVVEGKTPADKLPSGLGELDGLTKYFEKLAKDLAATKAGVEQQVKLRTSVLEVSAGMSELDKARADALLSSIGEAVIATDLEGKVSFLNDVAKRILWWEESAAIGVPVHSAFRLEDEKEQMIDVKSWPIAPTLQEKKVVVTPAPTKPFYIRRKDKVRFPAKLTISPLVIKDELVGALIIVNDITLEVDFDRRKSEFISIASHQLRSPATAIKLMTDMMRGGEFGPVTDKQKEWMGKLYNASDLMLDLVNELLNISRLESGSQLDLVSQDVVVFAQYVIKQAEPILIAKKQTFSFVQNGTAELTFDKMMIGEVMKNFMSNAHKYSPENGVITVSVEVLPDAVKIAVADQGMGIPKADHDKMFGKFFRAENARGSAIVGTGLGLYYCKTVIEKHGGVIGFDSEEGKGSTFWFTLPRAK